jgi:hypothetical protein
MGAAFKLPDVSGNPGTVGNWFASHMFYSCDGDKFSMKSAPYFNLPQNITGAGTYFAYRMFSYSGGLDFQQ